MYIYTHAHILLICPEFLILLKSKKTIILSHMIQPILLESQSLPFFFLLHETIAQITTHIHETITDIYKSN